MSKSKRRDIWTYLIVSLLIINLFVLNNYITSKAIKIIKAKNNASNITAFNVGTLTNGVTASYIDIVRRTKQVFGIDSNATIISTGTENISNKNNNFTRTTVINNSHDNAINSSSDDSNITVEDKRKAVTL